MTFHIITIFPEAIEPYFRKSILGKAVKRDFVKVKFYNLLHYSRDKHRKVDERAYGGGPGMVIGIEPVVRALTTILKGKDRKKAKIILFAPAGKQFDSKRAKSLSKYKHIILIAGRYEGIDARIKKIFRVDEISIGPYVLTGGELPAMAVVDAVSRYIKGVLGKEKSLEERRLGIGVPAYTRPEVFEYKGKKYKVPRVLLSGNHAEIEKWRKSHRK
jgi:tRNA (guanine37-N1)-methyltransferase